MREDPLQAAELQEVVDFAVHVLDARVGDHVRWTILLRQVLRGFLKEVAGRLRFDGQLDAAAFFQGHGFENVKSLRGGIDAWSVEVDPKLPRYHLEVDAE